VIPDADVIIAAAREALSNPTVSEKAVRAAVQEARQLARWPADEVAAIFYAFARRPRAFASHWALMTAFLARDQARALGVALDVTDAALHSLRHRVLRAEVDFDEVLAWFAERMPVD
jgi:hypothetical protein